MVLQSLQHLFYLVIFICKRRLKKMLTLLSTVKKHLNLDNDFNDDDEYLLKLIQVAEDAVAKRIDCRDLNDLVSPKTGYLPPSLQQSILLLIGNYYANRETTTFANNYELNKGFDFLVNLDKHYWIP